MLTVSMSANLVSAEISADQNIADMLTFASVYGGRTPWQQHPRYSHITTRWAWLGLQWPCMPHEEIKQSICAAAQRDFNISA